MDLQWQSNIVEMECQVLLREKFWFFGGAAQGRPKEEKRDKRDEKDQKERQ